MVHFCAGVGGLTPASPISMQIHFNDGECGGWSLICPWDFVQLGRTIGIDILAVSSAQCRDATEPQRFLQLSIFEDVKGRCLRPEVISLEGLDFCRNDVDG